MNGSYARRRGRNSFLLLACAALLLATTPAVADGHHLPEVILKVGERAQAGKFAGATSFYGPISPPQGAPPGTYCGGRHADPAPPWYPSPRRVPAGELSGRVEFRRADAPDELQVRGWTKFDERRGHRGPRGIGYTLGPLEEDGRVVAWVADVTLRVRKHLYLDVAATWSEEEDPDGCPESVEAVWRLHLKTRRA